MRNFYLAFFLLVSSLSFAQLSYEIDTTLNEVDLQAYICHYQDTNNDLGLHDFNAMKWEQLLKSPTFSSSNNLHWFKYRITNPYPTKVERYLFIPYHFIKEIDVYATRDSSFQLIMETGTSRSFSNKDLKSAGYPIKIVLEPNETMEYIFKFKHLYLPLRATVFLISEEKLESVLYKSFSILWLWKGVYLTVIIIASFLFFFVRQRVFLYYLGLNIGMGTYIAIQLGEFFVYFNSDPASYISIFDFGGSMLILFFTLLFINELTPLKKRNPILWKWIFRFLYGFIIIWFIRLFPDARDSMFMHYSHLYIISVGGFVSVLVPILLFKSVLYRDKNALYLFLIFSFYIIEAFVDTILPNLGIFSDSPFVNYGLLLASLTEMLAFMFIMAKESLTVYKEREKLILDQQTHQNQMINSIVNSQETERNRIGRELHDSLGANMAIIKQGVNRADESLYAVVSQSIDMVRNLSHSLLTPDIKNEDFKDELKELCHLFSTEIMKVQNYFFEWPTIEDATTTTHLYRIIQEILKNASKHSEATNVYLQFMGDNDKKISIIYEDNGKGFNPEKPSKKGVGLNNIRNRLELINGNMQIDASNSTKGATIIIEVELQ